MMAPADSGDRDNSFPKLRIQGGLQMHFAPRIEDPDRIPLLNAPRPGVVGVQEDPATLLVKRLPMAEG